MANEKIQTPLSNPRNYIDFGMLCFFKRITGYRYVLTGRKNNTLLLV